MKFLGNKWISFFFISLLVFLSINAGQNSNPIVNVNNIQPPPPPEISGGAAMIPMKVKGPAMDIGTAHPLMSYGESSTLTTFDAIDFDGDQANQTSGNYHIPPDPIGAAGPNHVVNVVNTSIEWYMKTGAQDTSQSLNSFFSPLQPLNDTFDPKVIYDQYADRFVVVTLERTDISDGAPQDTSRILLAVSDDSDPNGNWYFHAENSDISVSGVPTWADYPGFAVDEEAVYLTFNMFAYDSLTNQTSMLWIVDKGIGSGGFYDGGTATVTNHNAYVQVGQSQFASTTQPAHVFDAGPLGVGTFLIAYGGLTQGGPGGLEFVQVIRVDNPLGTPAFNHQFVPVGDIEDVGGSFGFPALVDAQQSGTNEEIEVNDRRALHAVWRDDFLYCTTTITPNSGSDAGQTTAHWFKINTASLGALVLADQGDVGAEDIAPNTFTFFPSVAVNMNGDMAIGFSASAATIFAGAYYTGRLATDPPGTVQSTQTLRAGLDFYERTFGQGRNRWGDYSGISLDPSDQTTFWVYNEYAITRGTPISGEDGRWGTAWGDFTLPVVSIDDPKANVSVEFELFQNYPNPFNPTTKIRFVVPDLRFIELKIYDITGKVVRTLLSETKTPGNYEVQWDGKDADGIELSSGTYFYKLEAGGSEQRLVEVRKMLLLR